VRADRPRASEYWPTSSARRTIAAIKAKVEEIPTGALSTAAATSQIHTLRAELPTAADCHLNARESMPHRRGLKAASRQGRWPAKKIDATPPALREHPSVELLAKHDPGESAARRATTQRRDHVGLVHGENHDWLAALAKKDNPRRLRSATSRTSRRWVSITAGKETFRRERLLGLPQVRRLQQGK
jgi:hypothetical protein